MVFILNSYFYFILTFKKYDTQEISLVVNSYYIYPFLTIFFVFSLRFSCDTENEYVVDFNIFTLSLSFSYYLLFLFIHLFIHTYLTINKIQHVNTLPFFFSKLQYVLCLSIKNIDIFILDFTRMIILYNISIHNNTIIIR